MIKILAPQKGDMKMIELSSLTGFFPISPWVEEAMAMAPPDQRNR